MAIFSSDPFLNIVLSCFLFAFVCIQGHVALHADSPWNMVRKSVSLRMLQGLLHGMLLGLLLGLLSVLALAPAS